MAGRIESGAAVPRDHLAEAVSFLQVFADRCHHGKEETALFPAMERAGVARDNGPIGAMLAEHEQGRALVRRMAGSLDAGADFAAAVRSYVALLTQHISKEDSVLFPLADRLLSLDVRQEMVKTFEEIEENVVGHGRHEQLHALLERLEAEYRRPGD
jgi:hemerythrin-like domain-containing protein